ncbi:MAG TPA: hypothetical protein VHV28_01470 [Solirubrobacteraceae bacterium]|nr:hypothetical protein [Solirubrobacteraceae bacterium]
MRRLLLAAAALASLVAAATPAAARAAACPHWGRPAVAADPRLHALRVFAIQFEQHPAEIATAADYRGAIDCALRREVMPHLAKDRPNVVVFDEDIGLETIAVGPRGAAARALLTRGNGCTGELCLTLATLGDIDAGYDRALIYLGARYPKLSSLLGRGFLAATDTFVRVFMTTMATEAHRHHLYIVASNTQAPFALTRDPRAVAALRDPGTPRVTSVYAPTAGAAYDQTFVWGPRVIHRRAPAPLANLLATNRKVPLTSFEQALGFQPGPSGGAAARRNLAPVAIPGSGARLGIATSLPAFEYGTATRAHACDDVAKTYMRCLDRLGANVVIQADANDGAWTGGDGADPLEHWQPLSWMGSAYRAVSDPSVRFAYAVNPFMVGNLADTPFDGQSAVLQRGLRGPGCHYVGNGRFLAGDDDPVNRAYAGPKPQFLALAPWAAPDGPRAGLRAVGSDLTGNGLRGDAYVQTALIADLPFPADRARRGCVVAGR